MNDEMHHLPPYSSRRLHKALFYLITASAHTKGMVSREVTAQITEQSMAGFTMASLPLFFMQPLFLTRPDFKKSKDSWLQGNLKRLVNPTPCPV